MALSVMRTPWWSSYFSFRPRRIEIVSSTVGSPTNTGLEAARQGGVLFDIFAVFIQRGGADAMQLAARQGRLEQVGSVHRPIRLAGAHQGMHLVDKKDDVPVCRSDFVEDGFQPLLEVAAELGAGDPGAMSERHQLLVAQAFGHVAIDDAQRQAFGDGGLAHAGLADQHRIVLGAAGQDLDGAADFLVAADHRVELARLRAPRSGRGHIS